MPRGGARPGAGRKPKEKAVVLGMDGQRREPAAGAAGQVTGLFDGDEAPQLAQPEELLRVPPRDLPPDQKKFWRAVAPRAIEQRTLTPATIVGFRLLCEQWVMAQRVAKSISDSSEIVGSKTAREKMRSYVQLVQRLDASLARFKLTGFGKADLGAKDPADGADGPSPWQEVAGR